ncbi:hypothetical protein BDV37DRAFT_164435 [Aspergillus pseudonomiae]|uniref:Ubiquitin carrier protein n=1 Tax=Aspergillus pseudonomiae TaxID=1506151 RepID=A0A5N7D8F5_9EURO|nr:uncharacterized protein BDV37DRAFT_164435 [Aspergillus pseudonomiae]KAE8402048.1 hypothetical protein BDV37DRAFT_164435 [Aspergillus pseudonomiae]
MVVSSLVRRGMELASAKDREVPSIHLSGWLAGLFVFSVLAFFFVVFSIEYTYGMVVATLAAIEDTNPDLYIRVESNFNPNKDVDPVEPEARTLRPQPVTSTLRTSIKHLRARAGFWSRFRGFGLFMTYSLAEGFLFSILPVSMTNFAGQLAARMIIGMALANLELTWVHIVISEPSSKRFYQRIPGFKSWLKIAPVVAFEQGAVCAAFYIPLFITGAAGALGDLVVDPNANLPPAELVSRAATAVAIPSLLAALVSIPARAVTIRVAASMLPKEDDAIVPFDRSFGGKVVPATLGGSGKLSIKDAWATFDGPARIRYLKVIGKAFAMEFAAVILFSVVLGCQVHAGALTYGIRRSEANA